MPVTPYQMYLIHFELPDGRHLATMNSLRVTEDSEKRWLVVQAQRALSSNPDVKILDIEPLRDDAHLQEETRKLKAENPDRPLAFELGLDTPNRILTDVSIPRGLAAARIPGGSNLTPGPSAGPHDTSGGEIEIIPG